MCKASGYARSERDPPRAYDTQGANYLMSMPTIDVIGIGNALVDVISQEADAFVEEQGLTKAAMTLVDEQRAHDLYGAMGTSLEMSGGSAANTIVGIASFGGRAHYVGKVRDDQLGEIFAHDIRATRVGFSTTPAADGLATGRCLIVVTPDAHRTMSTFLGASVDLTPDDIDPELIGSGAVLYLEGYLFDPPSAQEAFRVAARAAHDAGRKVSLTLSDGFCVDRHRQAFLDLVEGEVDILFANEVEIMSLYEVDTFDEALQHVRGHCEVAALTRSERGSVVVTNDEVHLIDAHPVAQLVDTTGAGDLYAAGFLFGYTQGFDLVRCGQLGSLAAAEIISHVGARPAVSLAQLAGSSVSNAPIG
jgi:sugar/nucleoside kinase (ribokinase family)